MYLSGKIRGLLSAALACAMLGCEKEVDTRETVAGSAGAHVSRHGTSTRKHAAAAIRDSAGVRRPNDANRISVSRSRDIGTLRSGTGCNRPDVSAHEAGCVRAGSEDSTQQQGGEGVLHRVVLAVPPERLSNARLLSDCPAVLYLGEE